ncbi:MAG TPA: hypothetical protein VNA16_02665 [Abditibacteriaceae bacterium]|nr:hypothetical protein [Abditibacteriaceae bacterium]
MKAASVRAHHARFIVRACTLLAVLHLAPPLGAQTSNSRFTYEAEKQVARPNGVRLEGKAHIHSPEIDVRAHTIVVDVAGNQITQVRAQGKVGFKLNLKPKKEGGATARIEATCDSATLDPEPRTLLLSGNVNGWYNIAGGARNTLSGDAVTLKYVGQDLVADVKGGTRGVSILIPAEKDNPAAIGAVTVTAQHATYNGSTGIATFTGKARAVSTDGPNKFDVAASEFVLTRSAAGVIDTLQTTGRTQIKFDLPPETPAAKATDGTAAKAADGTAVTPEIGRPTRVEAAADSVTVRRTTNTMDLQGNVKGFYELAAPGAPATKYDFAGDRVAIKYVTEEEAKTNPPQGLQVEMSGVPANFTAPPIDLNF